MITDSARSDACGRCGRTAPHVASRDSVVVQEQFPQPDRTWLTDTAGRRFAAEFVVPLVRRSLLRRPACRSDRQASGADLRPPGSDWLYVKLYCPADSETELLSGSGPRSCARGGHRGFADWFFIRYSDPRRHIRLRFRGEPARLLARPVAAGHGWAAD